MKNKLSFTRPFVSFALCLLTQLSFTDSTAAGFKKLRRSSRLESTMNKKQKCDSIKECKTKIKLEVDKKFGEIQLEEATRYINSPASKDEKLKNLEKALECTKKAYENKALGSISSLAFLYEAFKDYPNAFLYFTEAAEKENPIYEEFAFKSEIRTITIQNDEDIGERKGLKEKRERVDSMTNGTASQAIASLYLEGAKPFYKNLDLAKKYFELAKTYDNCDAGMYLKAYWDEKGNLRSEKDAQNELDSFLDQDF